MLSRGASDARREVRSDARPAASTVVAVVVTFHPDAKISQRLQPLIGQVGAILIVDNGSTPGELAPLSALIRNGEATAIINDANLGLATALNQGAAWAAAHGYRWFLTLDQDTSPWPTLVSEAARVFDAFPVPEPAVIGASWTGHSCPADPGRVTRVAITAGALHAIGPWAATGKFREDFFIDYVDIEYCLRVRKRGYQVLVSCRPTMAQDIGHPRRFRTPVRSFTTSNHDPVRRYYITRNRIRVWRMYWRREPTYVALDLSAAARELVKMLLFETKRRAKLAAVMRGVVDAVRGVAGPAPISIA